MTRDLCIMACAFCRDELFQDWVAERIGAATASESTSKNFILAMAGVDSRNDLDRDPAAAQRFHELVRKPFLAWKEHQQAAPVGR